MSEAWISATVCLLLGLLARLYTQRFEVRHLRWAWDFLRSQEENLTDEKRETVISRTHKALSTARLGRLLSLLILAPAFVAMGSLLQEQFDAVLPLPDLLVAFLWGGLLPFFLLAGFQFLLTAGFYRGDRSPILDRAPRWLVDDTEPVPGVIEAGWSMWDAMVRGGERLSRPFGLERPQAWLVEFEGDLLLAVGERELGAIDNSTSVEAPQRRTFGDRDETDMIRSIQRLDETLVREVMRPLNNVTAIPLTNLTSEKFLNIARRTGYTRFPCYYDQVTNLIGYLNVHDFLDSPVLPPDPRKLVHEALFIPELGRVDLVLREMQRARQQIAICFDEYGGCSGLLSREDIIEEITGEIMDEYDRPELKVQDVRGEYLVDGTIDLDDLHEMVGLDLSRETYVTLSGYIYYRLSRMPRRGESIDQHGWRIEVAQIEGHRVRKIRLVPPADFERPNNRASDVQPKPAL